MIKFGISKEYVPKWGVLQAIREIYQNFIDYGEFNIDIKEIDLGTNVSRVSLTNNFKPESWEFLKIGFSRKKDGAIGKHGEGLKLAGLIFNRNGFIFKITTPIGTATPVFYDDELLGNCYGLKVDKEVKGDFCVEFSCLDTDMKVFENSCVEPEMIIHSSSYGDIINKDAGEIYVGGLFVCKLENLKYAFDIKPYYIDLGRDRDIPSTWDIEYYTNQIINSCSKDLNFNPEDIFCREYNQGSIPKELAEKFSPKMTKEGIVLKAGKVVVSPGMTFSKIVKHKKVAEKVEKLRYKAVFKKNDVPSTVLKELRKSLNLNNVESTKFALVIKRSRSWKVK